MVSSKHKTAFGFPGAVFFVAGLRNGTVMRLLSPHNNSNPGAGMQEAI
jgi:hypothetical protein